MLASLNHPNIATIYGLERSDGATALVMEGVEGRTLADPQGPIPIDEAVAIAKQFAVHGSACGIIRTPNPEPRTPNLEPGTEPEHEPRTENPEV